MRTERPITTKLVTLCVALAVFSLVACQQSQTPTPAATSNSMAADAKIATTEKVFVIFEGPWAIVPDPKDANSVLAIAPKTKSHRSLALSPASVALEPGVYDLAVPAHGAPTTQKLDPSFLKAPVDPKNVQLALDNRSERYAIRLPKPEAYVGGSRHRSRVGATYPPDASTEQNYVSSVSLRYNVSSMTGFTLAGTKDAGGLFDPLLLQLDTPVIRFVIDPIQDFNGDPCDAHSREAFRDLVRLLNTTLYVDFPDNPDDCHKKDPQVAHSTKAGVIPALPLRSGEKGLKMQSASVTGGLAFYLNSAAREAANGLAAVIYYFHSDNGACRAPVIVDGP